ncbi:MAG: integrase [Nitrososphaerota archaeon]
MRPPGFEPGTAGSEGQRPEAVFRGVSGEKRVVDSGALLPVVTPLDSVADIVTAKDPKLWDAFERYVVNAYSRVHALNVLNYARRYGRLLVTGDLSPLLEMTPNKRRHVLAALAALSKFMGRYDEFKRLKARYGIKTEKPAKIMAQIDSTSLKELAEWIIKARERLSAFIDLALATGMRPREVLLCFNLIRDLHEKGRLGDYYRDGWLEHFRYEKLFLRRTKKAYVSYCPAEVVTGVTQYPEKLTVEKIRHRLEDLGPLRLNSIRKLWASYMTKFLTEPEINLLQGRVGKSVFMAHYFNPSYLIDLKSRIERGVKGLFAMIAAVTGVTSQG